MPKYYSRRPSVSSFQKYKHKPSDLFCNQRGLGSWKLGAPRHTAEPTKLSPCSTVTVSPTCGHLSFPWTAGKMYGEVLKLGRWKCDLSQPRGGIVKWARHFSGGPSHGYLSTSLLRERCMVNTCDTDVEHCMCNIYVYSFTCVHIVPSDIEVLETHYTHVHQAYLQRHVYITIKVATPRDYMFSTEGGKRSLNGCSWSREEGQVVFHTQSHQQVTRHLD